MALITGSWILDILLAIFSFFMSIYMFYQWKFTYWGRKNVTHTKPRFIFGDLRDTNTRRSFGGTFKYIYESYPNEKFVGMWMLFRPTVLVRDAEMIKNVLVKDFNYFHDRGFHLEEFVEDEPLLGHLFALNGQKWRNLRIKLTPTYTSGKMKMMFPTIAECGVDLIDVLSEAAEVGESFEAKDLMGRFSTDVITSCAFGIVSSSLKDPNSEFRNFTKGFTQRSFREAVTATVGYIWPMAIKIFRLKFVPPALNAFFFNAVKEVIDYREKNNVTRNDFMQLLIELKNKGRIEDADALKEAGYSQEDIVDDGEKFTIEKATAQAFVFFFAGFETSSGAMQFTLLELSLNPEIQKKGQEEVDRILQKHGKMTYEAVQEMDYIERIVLETLRKFPSATTLLRECTKDYKVPDMGVVIEKGTAVMIPVWGVHHDAKHYPDPQKFDPDRFTPEEKAKRHSYAFIPFGEGPRMCIGVRFAMLQMKVAIASILSKFDIILDPKTKLPLVMDPKHNLPIVVGGIHIKFQRRSQ